MITKYVVLNKEKKTLREWLEKNHLGKSNIYKLNSKFLNKFRGQGGNHNRY